MPALKEEEIRLLNEEIERRGLTYTPLQEELLDHLCCDLEAQMDEGLDFETALQKIREGMGENSIRQVQEATLLLVNQKYRIMKKLMYVLGITAPLLLILGATFKSFHWPGASVMIVLSLFMLGAAYLPVFVMVKIRDTREKGGTINKPMYIFGALGGIIFLTGAMFKINHWPGAGVMIYLSALVTLLIFIPILVIRTIKDKEHQVENFTTLVFVLAFIAITYMLFILRPVVYGIH